MSLYSDLFFIFIITSIIPLTYFYLCVNRSSSIFYPNRTITKTNLTFLIDEGYWNFTLNSFLQIKLEADVSPDLHYLIENHVKSLVEVHDSKIPITKLVKHYGSMSAVGMNIEISNSEIITVIFSRLWYSKKICTRQCDPERSYLYAEAFTSKYRRTNYNLNLKNGKVLKVPGLLNITTPEVEGCCLGPEDSRIVLDENNQVVFTFNMMDTDKRRKIWLYNLMTNHQVPLSIQNHTSGAMEKNWSPFIKDNKLHFVYSHNPFTILQCETEQGVCKFISGTNIHQQISSLRGGTQLVRYRNSDYYVGIARTSLACNGCWGFYRPHLVILSTNSESFHPVYVSEPLMLDELPMFASYFISQKRKTTDFCQNIIRIMTPGSIIDWKWPDDKLTFTVSINDMKSYVISIIGIGHIVESIIGAIESKYSKVFPHGKMVPYAENTALNYCESASNTNKFLSERIKAIDRYPKEKVVKTIINSPTYPTFRIASNTTDESLNLSIKSDYVNFGLIGRYLIDYEAAHGHQTPGTHMMINAGGNHGTYALYGAALNQSVLIFETVPDYWILIQESIRINVNFDERIILYPFGVSDEYQTSNHSTLIQAYPMNNFVFEKVSLMKIDIEGLEIRALKGAIEIIRQWGIGAILIKITTKRWSRNSITLDEGISVLKQVILMGKYMSYIIARNDSACPVSEISKLHGLIEVNNLSIINMQNGKFEVAPQIFRFTEWTTLMKHIQDNDWSCSFWLESTSK